MTATLSIPHSNLDFSLWEIRKTMQKAKNSAPGPVHSSLLMFRYMGDKVFGKFLELQYTMGFGLSGSQIYRTEVVLLLVRVSARNPFEGVQKSC